VPTERLDLVDAEGKTRAVLHIGAHGPRLRLLDAACNIRALLDVTQDGSRLTLGVRLPAINRVRAAPMHQMPTDRALWIRAFTQLLSENAFADCLGKAAEISAIIEKRVAEIKLLAAREELSRNDEAANYFAGNARADLRVTDTGPSLDLRDAAGEPLSGLDLDRNVTYENLADAASSLRAVLDVAMDEMHLDLYDAAGTLQEVLRMEDARPTVELRDAGDRVRGVLYMGTANLQFLLHDAGGNLRASLAVGEDGRRLCLYDAAGKLRASLAVTSAGPALVFLNAAGQPVWEAP
jgi:hypothetical protein